MPTQRDSGHRSRALARATSGLADTPASPRPGGMPADAPQFFATPEDFGAWLAQHAATHEMLVVGFRKVDSGHASMTWSQAVDEALCFGWVDGVRQRIDETAYKIRFTPRKHDSTWSAVNIAKVEALGAAGRMRPQGMAAFERRMEAKSRTYAYEQPAIATLSIEDTATFRANAAAWEYFEQQPPGYRKRLLWWVVSARQASTRASRLASLIDASARHERL